MNHISYNTTSSFVPDHIRPYYCNEKLVPEDKDFYGTLSPIKKAAIRIFTDRSVKRRGDICSHYTVRRSVVILTTDTEVVKIGLHLFPAMRIKRPLPLVEVHLKNKQGRKIALDLPEVILRQLTNYLVEGKPHSEFRCVEFLTYLFDYPEIYESYNFRSVPFNPSEIVPGDGIVLFGSQDQFLHQAMYLGKDLYLWHCGPTCICISSYREMMHAYHAVNSEILRPLQTQRPFTIDIHSSNLNIRRCYLEYYQNEELVPEDRDFYKDVAPITEVEIEINPQKSIDCASSQIQTKFKLLQAAVVFRTSNEILRIGLHLFPTMRVKRKLPDARLFILDDAGKRPLPIAQAILRNLSRYLEEGKPNLHFYCFQFINFIHGIPLTPTITPFLLSDFEEEKITPGDSVLLLEYHRPLHMALYIGAGLYLWHIGPSGLAISNLQNMQDAYRSKEIRLARLDPGESDE